MPNDVLIVACSVIFFILGFLAGFSLNKLNKKKQKNANPEHINYEDFKSAKDYLASIKKILNISQEERNDENKPNAQVFPDKKNSNPFMEILSELRVILNKLQNPNSERVPKSKSLSELKNAKDGSSFPFTKNSLQDFSLSQDMSIDKNYYETGADPGAFDTQAGYSLDREPTEAQYRRIPFEQQFAPADEFIRQYNQAFIDRKQRQQFWDNYKNFFYFGNKNAAAQARGEDTSFDFRTKDGGDFIAVKLPNDDNFFVVPRFDTTINNTTFNEGGFGEVFECFNYLPDHSYSLLKIEKPAVFRQNGDQWILVDPGKMLLQA